MTDTIDKYLIEPAALWWLELTLHAAAASALEHGRRDVARLLRQGEGLARLAVVVAQAPPAKPGGGVGAERQPQRSQKRGCCP